MLKTPLQMPPGDTHFAGKFGPENYQLLHYETLLSYTKTRTLAIDIGAHAGIFTTRFARDFESVLAFEPIHGLTLRANTDCFSNVEIEDVALGDRSRPVQMRTRTDNSGDCRVAETGDTLVEQMPLDRYQFNTISCVKIDAQGSEYRILRGGAKTFARHRPPILIEIEPDDPDRETTHNLLISWNYTQVWQKNADRIYIG